MIKLLQRRGRYNVEVAYNRRPGSPIAVPPSSRIPKDRVHVVGVTRGLGRISQFFARALTILQFFRVARKIRPELIHAWNYDTFVAGYFATFGRRKIQMVYHLQDTYEWMRTPVGLWLQRLMFRSVNLFFVTSAPYENQYLRHFNLVPADVPVVYVPNVPEAKEFEDFEAREAGSRNGLTVGYFGFFRGKEALTSLVEGVRLARGDGGDHRVLFAGVGREVGLVEQLAKENEFVSFDGGYRQEELKSLYQRVDLVYAVYDKTVDFEIALAYRLCEAINCRLPSIVGYGTHMADLVMTHGVGFNVPPGDPEVLATILSSIHENPEELQRIAENCEKARREFVFEEYEERICRAYERLLES